MHSTLSLLTYSSESEEDYNEETFEDIQTPDYHDLHQTSLEEDQGNPVTRFTNSVYLNAVIQGVIIDFALPQVLLMTWMTGILRRSEGIAFQLHTFFFFSPHTFMYLFLCDYFADFWRCKRENNFKSHLSENLLWFMFFKYHDMFLPAILKSQFAEV